MPQPRRSAWPSRKTALPDRPLTLRQEALETSRRSPSIWGQDARLRHNPVAFISAGASNPLKADDEEAADTAETVSEKQPVGIEALAVKPTTESEEAAPHTNHTEPMETETITITTPTNTHQGNIQRQEQEKERSQSRRSSSSAKSDSGEETVLLFKGRRTRPVSDHDPFSLNAISSELDKVEGNLTESALQPTTVQDTEDNSPGKDETPTAESETEATTGNGSDAARESDALYIDDYFENLLHNGDDMDELARFYGRDLGGADDEMGFSHDQEPPSEIDSDDFPQYTREVKGRRLKKAERKKLRAQGLLPKETKPRDLWTKYPTSMTMEQIVDELKVFLISSEAQVSFPPLSKHFRKVIHELANKVSLKSKSIGGGQTRRPVLYRTKATPKYSDEWFDSVTGRLTARFFGKRVKGAASRNGGRAGAHTGYRDGDVVGQGLPELGTENRGRAMLEKMGWSSGTALGTMENKGILQPVAQVVKRTKAGLG